MVIMSKRVGIAFVLALFSVGLRPQTLTGTATTLHIKKFVAPAYPSAARKNRMQGTTTSELQVRADGTVESVKVVMAHPVFHFYVEKALRQWLFEPSVKSTPLTVTVRFSLDECQGYEESSETLVQAELPDSVEVRTCLEPIVTNVN
jgi:TonB family protein